MQHKNRQLIGPHSLGTKLSKKTKVFSHLSASLLAVVCVFIFFQFDLLGLRGFLVDALFRTQWWSAPHPDIKLIAYNDESSARYEGSTKIPVEELVKIFDILSAEKPLAVAVLAPINDKVYSENELTTLSQAFFKIPNTFVGYTDDESLGKYTPRSLFHSARYVPGFVSRDTFSYGADSVTRRVMVMIEGIPTVFAELADLYHGVGPDSADAVSRSRLEKVGDSSHAYINWQGRAGTYPITSSLNFVQNKVAPGTYTNKIVLVSTALHAKREKDFIFTPYSREHFATTYLEGAANSVATLIRDNGIKKTSWIVDTLLSLLIGIITVNVALFLSPGRGVLFVVFEIFSLFTLSWFLLTYKALWINTAHPLVIACVGYYLVIPYRLLDEYRKRWHYQEKSELMAQLEQLKSNFLSLVSHDLKTPIARIQGNAELALRASHVVPTEVKNNLESILNTTEDLGHTIETILDLTRIESAKMPLQKTSKDVNVTIKEVIASKMPMASEKGIEIQAKLDPLFSIKFDVKLIQQVIANLVENAIKYSPENTIITLSSKEEGSWVKIEVTDQGAGIAPEDQEKVFSKFYRCGNPNTQKVKGTGLGLYLVKYFVELHNGMVELKSETGKGSTFTVALPV